MGRIWLKRIDLQLTLKRLVFLYECSDAFPSARPQVQKDMLPPACQQVLIYCMAGMPHLTN